MPVSRPKSSLKRCSSYTFNSDKLNINSEDLLKDIDFRLYGQQTTPKKYAVTKKPPRSQPILKKDSGDVIKVSKYHPNFTKKDVNLKNIRSNSFTKPQLISNKEYVLYFLNSHPF